jgi:hypothetical protein
MAAQFSVISGSSQREEAVQAFRDQLLAGAALADHQHRAAQRAAAGALHRVQKGAGPDELRFAIAQMP